MTCERNRPEVREVALGAAPSKRHEDHLASCLECRAALAEERSRLAGIDDAIGQALAVDPSPSLLPRVREVATRQLAEPRGRFVWLVPVAASLIALAVLVPLARRISPPSGSRRAALPPLVTEPKPPVSPVEVPSTAARPEPASVPRIAPANAPSSSRRAAPRAARSARAEPEVIVPPGGEAALRRYVQAIRNRRVVDEVVLGPRPDPVDWTEPASMRKQPRTVERFPQEMEPATAGAEALTRGD